MKILEVLISEGVREERITQQKNANVLRHLYDEKRRIKQDLNQALIDGDDQEVSELEQELADIDANIRQLEAGSVTESEDMVAKARAAVKDGLAKLKEMESDLRLMDNTARSEEEYDAVDDFRKEVERQRRMVDRLKKNLKMHLLAKDSGVMESTHSHSLLSSVLAEAKVFFDKNGTRIKDGDTLYNPMDRDK